MQLCNAVITIAIPPRYDYDLTTTYHVPGSIQREQKMSIFRHNQIVHIVISITFVVVECVVVSSYCSGIVIVIGLSNTTLERYYKICLDEKLIKYRQTSSLSV